MSPSLKFVALLVIIATTMAASLTADKPLTDGCEGRCSAGQVCTEQQVQCFTTPCPPMYTCQYLASPAQKAVMEPEAQGGVYDISNKRRLGQTEYQAVKEMQDGTLELIKTEDSLY